MRGSLLCGPIIDFPAMPEHSDYKRFFLAIRLINYSIVAHTKFEEARERSSQRFGLNRVKIPGKPAEFSQHTSGNHLIEALKFLGRLRAEFDSVHLPFHAPAAGQFGRWNILAVSPRLLEVLQKAISNFGPNSQTCVRIGQQLAQLFLNNVADEGLQIFRREVFDHIHILSLRPDYTLEPEFPL